MNKMTKELKRVTGVQKMLIYFPFAWSLYLFGLTSGWHSGLSPAQCSSSDSCLLMSDFRLAADDRLRIRIWLLTIVLNIYWCHTYGYHTDLTSNVLSESDRQNDHRRSTCRVLEHPGHGAVPDDRVLPLSLRERGAGRGEQQAPVGDRHVRYRRSLCDCHAISLRLIRDCYAIVMRLLCDCNGIATRLPCEHRPALTSLRMPTVQKLV